MAPNYQAGKDALAGFKQHFKGEIVDEVYVPLGQLDFSAELAKIAAAKPDAIFVFMPGGMGVNFVKQFRQAGPRRQDPVPLRLHGRRVDAAGAAGRGARLLRRLELGAEHRQPAEQGVRRRLREGIQRGAGDYAFQAYDAALLIDSALKAPSGKTDDKDALRAALKKADFKSLRGAFKFNTNHYPIQDFYLVKVGQAPRRQVPDRDRRRRCSQNYGDCLRQGLPDEVTARLALYSRSSPLSARGRDRRLQADLSHAIPSSSSRRSTACSSACCCS